jgi:hypothetical protein
MAFREVAVTEIREVLRARLSGAGLRQVAAQAGWTAKSPAGMCRPQRRRAWPARPGLGARQVWALTEEVGQAGWMDGCWARETAMGADWVCKSGTGWACKSGTGWACKSGTAMGAGWASGSGAACESAAGGDGAWAPRPQAGAGVAAVSGEPTLAGERADGSGTAGTSGLAGWCGSARERTAGDCCQGRAAQRTRPGARQQSR